MNLIYNIALYVGFLFLTPRFFYDFITDGKWAAGFKQRLGNVPSLDAGGRKVVLLHCVSVGEANAAFPLARKLKERSPDIALVVSTTTKTGQKVARDAYSQIADLVVYFPFDLRWAVKRFLRRVRPSVVLLTETELWFNFIRLAHKSDARIALVNGRLSQRSFGRYAKVKGFMMRLLSYVDLALMQTNADAQRLMSLGAHGSKVKVTGNLKYELDAATESELTLEFRRRFAIGAGAPLILAASTHSPEEKLLLDAFKQIWKDSGSDRLPRIMIAPRHPERFDEVAAVIKATGFTFARRSENPSARDKTAEVVLLDSIGELKAAYPLADVVFVGGSLIPHGGQSIFEPAAAGKAMVTGPYTANFDAAVKEFLTRDALIQLPDNSGKSIVAAFDELLDDAGQRGNLGTNALAVIEANRGAADRTIEYLTPFFTSGE
ncbi:MAG: 3-deoxy-D-manno-octulosonic acid transferase [Acidobacteria bacterium]|nr:3-deoxy-D-manno-octulosonic acid transferase [Acidobacteriota bacterium]